MSNLNLNWLSNNLTNNPIIFDIGCADMHDTIKIKNKISNGIFYAFECSSTWKEQNLKTALKNDINYFHMAMSDIIGTLTFYPSDVLDGQEWPWSGSV